MKKEKDEFQDLLSLSAENKHVKGLKAQITVVVNFMNSVFYEFD